MAEVDALRKQGDVAGAPERTIHPAEAGKESGYAER